MIYLMKRFTCINFTKILKKMDKLIKIKKYLIKGKTFFKLKALFIEI